MSLHRKDALHQLFGAITNDQCSHTTIEGLGKNGSVRNSLSGHLYR